MHHNNICPGIIHVDIILVCTLHPGFDILLQAWGIILDVLPLHHELLKCRNGITQDRGALARHGLLDLVWTLLAQLHQDTYNCLLVTHTQNNLDI